MVMIILTYMNGFVCIIIPGKGLQVIMKIFTRAPRDVNLSDVDPEYFLKIGEVGSIIGCNKPCSTPLLLQRSLTIRMPFGA